MDAKHSEHEVRGAKAVNNRIETESEENDYGTDKKNGQRLTRIGGYVYGRWKEKVPLGFERA